MTRTSVRLLALVLVVLVPLTSGSAVAQHAAPESATRARLEALGLQSAEKHEPTPAQVAGTQALPGVNPFLGQPPADAPVDTYFYRRLSQLRAQKGDTPAAASAARAAQIQPIPTVEELEPDELFGRNDTLATAQLIAEVGTGAGELPEVEIEGTIAEVPVTEESIASVEDDGAIPLANPTFLGGETETVRAQAAIGDGPHGTLEGDGTGDFDFYALPGLEAGQTVVVDVDAGAIGSDLDPVAIIWDSAGNPLALNDDAGGPGAPLDSFLTFVVPEAGDYYASVVGFPSVPEDPFDSGSGPGAGSEGAY